MSHSHLSDFYFSQVLAENVTFSSREWQLKSQGTNKGRREYHQWLVEACEDAGNNDYWRPGGTICPTLGDHGGTRGQAFSKRASSPCRSGIKCQACCPPGCSAQICLSRRFRAFPTTLLAGQSPRPPQCWVGSKQALPYAA